MISYDLTIMPIIVRMIIMMGRTTNPPAHRVRTGEPSPWGRGLAHCEVGVAAEDHEPFDGRSLRRRKQHGGDRAVTPSHDGIALVAER